LIEIDRVVKHLDPVLRRAVTHEALAAALVDGEVPPDARHHGSLILRRVEIVNVEQRRRAGKRRQRHHRRHVVLAVNDVRGATDLPETVHDGDAAAPQSVGEPAADTRREHDRPMAAPIESARDLIDNDLGAGSEGERDVRDENRQTLTHGCLRIP
jgi:hypothetical protein